MGFLSRGRATYLTAIKEMPLTYVHMRITDFYQSLPSLLSPSGNPKLEYTVLYKVVDLKEDRTLHGRRAGVTMEVGGGGRDTQRPIQEELGKKVRKVG